jgi:hypothetical protein
VNIPTVKTVVEPAKEVSYLVETDVATRVGPVFLFCQSSLLFSVPCVKDSVERVMNY